MVVIKVAPNVRAALKGPPSDLQKSLKPLLIPGQCFALLPVVGISSASISDIRFEWRSWRTAYSLATVVIGAVNSIVCIYRVIKHNFGFYKLGNLIFWTNAFVTTLLFFNMARRWPNLMRQWREAEISMYKYGQAPNFSKTFKIFISFIAVLALFEHVLVTHNTLKRAIDCHIGYTIDEIYFRISAPHIFHFVPYSRWLAVIWKFLSIQATFAWTFKDVFIMVISNTLSIRLKQLNARINAKAKRKTDEHFWKDVREDYSRLCHICKVLDNRLSSLIISSYLDNLYSLCCQLYNIFKPMDTFGVLYFSVSTCLVIIRLLGVSLQGASIYDESRASLPLVHSIPSWSYNTEIERFVHQLTSDTVALSGMKFFYITRSLVLSITGTILTYELVLFQFNTSLISDAEFETNKTIC